MVNASRGPRVQFARRRGISPAMSFQSFFNSIQSEALRVLAQQWAAARGGRAIPRFAISIPWGSGRHLRYVWAWKYESATENFTGRLAGEEIDRAFGKSLRGMKLTEFYTPDVYAVVFPRHQRVVTEPCFFHGTGMVFARMGYTMGGERDQPAAVRGRHAPATASSAAPITRPCRPPDEDIPLGPDFTVEQVDFFPLDMP